MQIIFFIRQFPTLSETFVINQVIDIKKRGHEVFIMAEELTDGEAIHRSVLENGLLGHCYSEPIPRNYFKRYLKLFLLLTRKRKSEEIKFLIRSLNFFRYGRSSFNLKNFYRLYPVLQINHKAADVVIAHFGSEGVFATNLMAMGLFGRARLITAFHGIDVHPSKKINAAFYKKLFSTASLVTANTCFTKQQLLKLNCPENKIRILHEGLDTQYFRRRREEKLSGRQKTTIAFVGRLVDFKGADKIVPVVKLLKRRIDDDFRMLVIGGGPLMSSIQKAVVDNNLGNTVVVKGRLIQSDIIRELSRSHIFLYPGRRDKNGREENQGLVLQEAQALELPVVCSDIGGMPEGIIDGQTGFLLEENDLEGFVEKLEYLIKNPETARAMGKEGRQFVINKFDTKVLGDKLESFINEICLGYLHHRQ